MTVLENKPAYLVVDGDMLISACSSAYTFSKLGSFFVAAVTV